MIQHSYLDPKSLTDWNEGTAHLAVAVGTEEIGSALSALLKIIVDFDAIFLATFRRDAPPTVAYFVGTREPEAHYQDGPYLLDPFYAHFLDGGADGCYRLSDLAPDGFRRSEYFSTYYGGLNIGDELGLLVAMDPPSAELLKSIGRFAPAHFSAGGLLNRLSRAKQLPKRGSPQRFGAWGLAQFSREPCRAILLDFV